MCCAAKRDSGTDYEFRPPSVHVARHAESGQQPDGSRPGEKRIGRRGDRWSETCDTGKSPPSSREAGLHTDFRRAVPATASNSVTGAIPCNYSQSAPSCGRSSCFCCCALRWRPPSRCELLTAEHGGVGSGTTAARNLVRRHFRNRVTVAIVAQEHPQFGRSQRAALVNGIYEYLLRAGPGVLASE